MNCLDNLVSDYHTYFNLSLGLIICSYISTSVIVQTPSFSPVSLLVVILYSSYQSLVAKSNRGVLVSREICYGFIGQASPVITYISKAKVLLMFLRYARW